jgi:hypothetical protein
MKGARETMDSPQALEARLNASAPASQTSQLRGASLALARILWLTLALPPVALTVIGVPLYYRLLLTPCTEVSSCGELNGALTLGAVRFLQEHGISIGVYAALHTVFNAVIILIWWVIAFLIFARRSDDVFALVAALFLMFYGVTAPATFLEATRRAHPVLNGGAAYVLLGTTFTSIVFFVYFPTLRSAPRWFLFVIALGIGKSIVDLFQTMVPDWMFSVAYVAFYGAVIVAQVYRYRHISTPSERQQTKWVVAGISVATGGVIVLLLLSTVSSFILSLYTPYLLGESWTILLPLASAAIPITVGVAILRYQLLDIDVLINRALVYGSLTGVLAILYLGLVVGAQSIFSKMTDQRGQTPLIIVSSTLVIAGLFQPLRGRIQKIIDRRFYRSKYDARKAVEAFSATLRQELSLTELREQLVSVVTETMRPRHVSLWLAPHAEEPVTLIPSTPASRTEATS